MALSPAHAALELRIPAACPVCAAVGRVVLEPAVATGDTVLLAWRCARCRQSWPVTSQDVAIDERRQEIADRRHTTRTDRRKP